MTLHVTATATRVSRWLTAAAGLLLAMSGAPAWSEDFQLERQKVGLVAEGDLTPAAVEQLRNNLREGDLLVIDSGRGGDPIAAQQLGFLIHRLKIRVEVTECVNLCAIYVFLPAAARYVDVGHEVRFSGTPFVLAEAIQRHGGEFSKAERARFRRYFVELKRFLDETGIPLSLLRCIDTGMQPDIGAILRGEPMSNPIFSKEILIPSRFSQLALSKEVFESFGVKIEGRYRWTTRPDYRDKLANIYGARVGWLDSPGQCDAGAVGYPWTPPTTTFSGKSSR